MTRCEKVRCIANVSGKCSVAQCKGEITSTGRHPGDAAAAAKFYEASKEAFAHYFGTNYEDDDKEE